jgi:hypothetical protein
MVIVRLMSGRKGVSGGTEKSEEGEGRDGG